LINNPEEQTFSISKLNQSMDAGTRTNKHIRRNSLLLPLRNPITGADTFVNGRSNSIELDSFETKYQESKAKL
jgi:hypothetical protein